MEVGSFGFLLMYVWFGYTQRHTVCSLSGPCVALAGLRSPDPDTDLPQGF